MKSGEERRALAFDARARRTALALSQAVIPPGRRLRGGDARTVDALEELLAGFGPAAIASYARLLDVLEHAPRARHFGRGFSRLTPEQGERFLQRWVEGALPLRTMALGLTAPLKVAHFDEPDAYRTLGGVFRFDAAAEHPAWMAQVTAGDAIDDDLELECDAVVVGSGAGGAVVAAELARMGHAVLILEEGDYYGRHDFNGRGAPALQRFYRGRGTTGTVGNTFIPVPMGRLVGGSTAINTGTCWRTPDWVLRRFVEEDGLVDLAPDRMAPYFERVERVLEVTEADPVTCGAVGRVIARGADALGWSNHPLLRNAPGCDGSGVCDMGCPTGARRSTNVSYVPNALRSGARLVTGVRASRLLRTGARVDGIEGRVLSTGRRVRVRASATVLACGTLMTPALLTKNGVHRRLRHVGRHLSIHPATTVSALFDEPIHGYRSIPQGWCVDELHREGILMMGASAPIDLGAGQFAFVGRQFMDLMDAYDRIASFGVMVEDRSLGRVVTAPGGRATMLYRLGRRERDRLVRGVAALCRIYLAAGAREVYPALHGHRVIHDGRDVRRLERSRPAAADFLLTAFHPLGTCRMATSASRGVVGPDHAVFGLDGLYVADGSVVPASLAVNPQETIMAMATRAADLLSQRLD